MPPRQELSAEEKHALEELDAFDWTRVQRISEELHKESDRAAIVLGAAWLDEGLAALLRAVLLPAMEKKEESDELLGLNGPLGDFASRIKLCHRLGLINDDFRKAIDIIRKMRNKFAHSVETPDLSASPFREWIKELPLIVASPTFWDLYQKKYYGDERGPRVTLRSTLSLLNSSVASSVPGARRIAPQHLLGTMIPVRTKPTSSRPAGRK
jgi:DNA-binding MltR family transcriptional regulator